MTGVDARAALKGLLDTPVAVPLEEPISVGTIIAMAEQVSRARTERDAALTRLRAVRRAVWPLLRRTDRLGDLARTIHDTAHRTNPAA